MCEIPVIGVRTEKNERTSNNRLQIKLPQITHPFVGKCAAILVQPKTSTKNGQLKHTSLKCLPIRNRKKDLHWFSRAGAEEETER